MANGLGKFGTQVPRPARPLSMAWEDDPSAPLDGGSYSTASSADAPLRDTTLPPLTDMDAAAQRRAQTRADQIRSATSKVNGSQVVTDYTTPAGIGVALVFLLLAIIIGGAPLAFLNLPAFFIVFGGVGAVTVASFNWSDISAIWPVIQRTVQYRHRTPRNAALHVLELADYARHNGVLKLDGLAHDSTHNEPLLHEGLQHVIDALPVEDVELSMKAHSAARRYRHGQATSLLRRAADVAPAMGLIGTLVGLVQMLGRLDDPAAIGPGMAVALLTTLYGAALGHLVLAPLAAKLERLSAAEALLDEIYILAVASIGRKDNPRRLQLQLNSILPPPERVSFYD